MTKTQIKNYNMLTLKLRIHIIARDLDQTEVIDISEQESEFKVETMKKNYCNINIYCVSQLHKMKHYNYIIGGYAGWNIFHVVNNENNL